MRSTSNDPPSWTADDAAGWLEELLSFLSSKPRSFAEAARAIAARAAVETDPRQRATQLTAGILEALESDVASADWRVSVAGYVFAHEDFLLRTRGIAMNVAPVLSQFGPEESDDVVMHLDSPLTQAIARQAVGARFVSICPSASDQYIWGAIAARDADAVAELVAKLGLDKSIGLTIDRPKGERAEPVAKPRPARRRKPVGASKGSDAAARARVEVPDEAAYWAEAVAVATKSSRVRLADDAGSAVVQRYCALLARYSRGDALSEIAAAGRKLVGHDVPDFVERFPPSLTAEGERVGFELRNRAWAERFAALLVLSRGSAAEAQAFSDAYRRCMAPSLLVDALLAHLGATISSPATAVSWPGVYQPLFACVAPEHSLGDADRIAQLQYFLAYWHRRMRHSFMAPSWGSVNNRSYVGHWSLEAAATAVVARIDDSAFRDHPHYPSDFADAAR